MTDDVPFVSLRHPRRVARIKKATKPASPSALRDGLRAELDYARDCLGSSAVVTPDSLRSQFERNMASKAMGFAALENWRKVLGQDYLTDAITRWFAADKS